VSVQVLIGSTELLTPERALQRLHCTPPTAEELAYESASLEPGQGGAGGNGEPSALDACLDQIPFEKLFPCCFRPEVSLQPATCDFQWLCRLIVAFAIASGTSSSRSLTCLSACVSMCPCPMCACTCACVSSTAGDQLVSTTLRQVELTKRRRG
jgi:hypothetical protein